MKHGQALNVYEWMTDIELYDMLCGMEGIICRSKQEHKNDCAVLLKEHCNEL